jgi:hypothetical protein
MRVGQNGVIVVGIQRRGRLERVVAMMGLKSSSLLWFKGGWKGASQQRAVFKEWVVGVGRRSGSSKWVVGVGRRSGSSKSVVASLLFKEGWNGSSERVALDQVVVVVQNGQRGQEGGWSKQALSTFRGLDRLSSFKVDWKGGCPCQYSPPPGQERVFAVGLPSWEPY